MTTRKRPLVAVVAAVAVSAVVGGGLLGAARTQVGAAAAEDDDHLLLLWHDRQEPQSRSAVVRCTVSTGQCELATPLSPEPLLLGS